MAQDKLKVVHIKITEDTPDKEIKAGLRQISYKCDKIYQEELHIRNALAKLKPLLSGNSTQRIRERYREQLLEACGKLHEILNEIEVELDEPN